MVSNTNNVCGKYKYKWFVITTIARFRSFREVLRKVGKDMVASPNLKVFLNLFYEYIKQKSYFETYAVVSG